MMVKEILRNCVVGFIFGLIIALIAYFGNFQIPVKFILIMPVFFSVLNLLGSMAAIVLVMYLAAKRFINEKILNIIGFITAAVVNTLIAFAVILRFDEIFFRSEIIFLYFAGMAMGAVYGVYRYRIELMNERVKFLEEISDKNRQIQEAARQLAITMERNRMGRELHDSISQGLHGLMFSIHSLRNQLPSPPEEVRATLNHMEAAARSTQDELRAMIEELKPSLLAESGLADSLRTISDLFSQRQNIPVELQLQIPENITPKVEMAIYRISQEALSNIEKHALSKRVTFDISYDQERIQLNIKDNGKGFNTRSISSGHGLRNMRLRAEEIGGSADIISSPNLGTSIVVTFPYKG